MNIGHFYRIQGHHFMGLSDHNKLTPTESYADPSQLLGIPSCEYTGEACCHVLGVGVSEAVGPAPSRRTKPRPKVKILQDGIDQILAAGGIPVVCHPNWRFTLGPEEMLKLENLTHFEICNASPDCNSFPVPGYEPGDNLWDALLSAGRRVYGLANDDAHEYYIPPLPRTSIGGLGYNVVKAPSLTVENIMAAIREGRFYATSGVIFKEYRVTEKGIELSLEKLEYEKERVVFQFFGKNGEELQRSLGNEVFYEFRGNEDYVRVRAGSTAGLWAWTQPVFMDELEKAISWTQAD